MGEAPADWSHVDGEGGAAGEESEDDEGPVKAAPAAEAKTIFTVKMKAFDAAKKIKIIKEVRTITNLGLKEVLKTF